MKLLFVEDDLFLVEALLPQLRKAGYAVEHADNGVDALFLAQEEAFDVMILDLGLPQKNGMEVLRELRNKGSTLAVLILTGRDSWHERVDGLKAGADDYLGKPFHHEELLARIEALIRRQYGLAENTIRHAGVVLDTQAQCLTDSQGKEHKLTAIEFRLIHYFFLNPKKYFLKPN